MNDKQQNTHQPSSSEDVERSNAVHIEENIAQHVEKLKRIRKQMLELRTAFNHKMDRIFNTQKQDEKE
jgi:hypothetical protein